MSIACKGVSIYSLKDNVNGKVNYVHLKERSKNMWEKIK